jgi:glycosyltransferase involved in cell wall biosynthesis
MKPLFSVLIANYNNGKYIDEAIESVLNQTYQNWEIIIVDDASTDNSMEILSKYQQESRFRIYENDINYGCGYTKRKCAELAKGEIAGFLDPDDILHLQAIEKMIESHESNDLASMIYSNLIICNEFLKDCKLSTYIRPVPDEFTYLQMNSGMVSQFATFKLRSYRKTTGIDASFLRAVDQDLYLKLEEVGKLVFLNEPLYMYRINKGGISSFENKNKAFAWNIFARINACRRRGLNIEEVLVPIIKSEQSIREFYENSTDYRIGSLILTPYRWVKYNLLKINK